MITGLLARSSPCLFLVFIGLTGEFPGLFVLEVFVSIGVL